MEYVYVGKITSTHGIKGELKIKSYFKYKDLVFKKNNIIYIDKEPYKITSYRSHKGFDMVTINNFDDINAVLKYIGKGVYIDKNSTYLSDKYLDEDLIGMDVYYDNKYIGKVTDIVDAGSNNILIKLEHIYIPYNSHFVSSIDKDKKIIFIVNAGELGL